MGGGIPMGITRKMPRWQASRSTTPRRGSARRKSVHAQSLRAATIAAACAPEADLRALATDTRSDPGPPKPSDPRARPIASTPRSPACFRMGVGTCFTRGAYGRTGDLSCPAGLPNHKRLPRGFTRRVPRPRTGTIDIRSMLDCLSGNISLNHGHFWPRGQYMRRLGQDVSSADEIGIALVIAGDTSKHLSHAVAPIVLTTSGTCSGGASRIDSNGPNTVFPCQRFDPLSHPPIRLRGAAAMRKSLPRLWDLPRFNPFKSCFRTELRPEPCRAMGVFQASPTKRAESEPPRSRGQDQRS
jgi:hypothetical protein